MGNFRIKRLYDVKGYAINNKRLEILNKTVAIQSKILASAFY